MNKIQVVLELHDGATATSPTDDISARRCVRVVVVMEEHADSLVRKENSN